MTRPASPQAGPQAGFTLVEVLAALAVLALVLAAAAGGIGTMGAGFAKGGARVDALEDLSIARDVLRRQAARSFPLIEGRPDQPRYAFEGTATGVAFPILEPPAPGRGGVALARFMVEDSPAGQRLVYTQASMSGGPERRSMLAEGPYRFAFSYLEARPDGAPVWRSDWVDPATLPVLIRLEMAAEGRDRPGAIVRFRADAERGCVLLLGEGYCRDFAGGPS